MTADTPETAPAPAESPALAPDVVGAVGHSSEAAAAKLRELTGLHAWQFAVVREAADLIDLLSDENAAKDAALAQVTAERDRWQESRNDCRDYSIKLCRIIEAICRGKPLREGSADLHHHRMAAEFLSALAAERERAEAAEREVERLRALIDPMVRAAALCDDPPGTVTRDAVEIWQTPNARWPITYGDLRRARAKAEGRREMREAAAKIADAKARGLEEQASVYRPPSAAPDETLADQCDQAACMALQIAAAIRALDTAPTDEPNHEH